MLVDKYTIHKSTVTRVKDGGQRKSIGVRHAASVEIAPSDHSMPYYDD